MPAYFLLNCLHAAILPSSTRFNSEIVACIFSGFHGIIKCQSPSKMADEEYISRNRNNRATHYPHQRTVLKSNEVTSRDVDGTEKNTAH